jgi:hypothetical protein
MFRVQTYGKKIVWLTFALLTATTEAQVSIPTMIVDGSGHAIHGLQKSDFDV